MPPRVSSSSSRREDASIRRGAAVIRNEITRQFNMSPPHQSRSPPAASVSSSSESTDFSDVWLNTNPYGQQQQSKPRRSLIQTPPRIKPPRPTLESSLEYSAESSSFGTTPEDVRTFASKGDASQWAKGSVLVSPESPPLVPTPSAHDVTWSPPAATERTRKTISRDYDTTQHQKYEEQGFDFIGPDYVEEFELDDYDEVCHPLYSRELARTPPASKPPLAKTPHKHKRTTTSHSATTVKAMNIVGTYQSHSGSRIANVVSKDKDLEEDDEEPTVAVTTWDERRQGPPSHSSGGSVSTRSSRSSSNQQKQQDYQQYHPARCEVPSPLQVDYEMLLQDPAYLHAQRAGHLWQSLVGQMIRFPSRWWNGARTPPLGADDDHVDAEWQYLGRFASQDVRLRRFVKNRAAPGRLLLHIVMMDLVTCKPLQDIAVGCFHPGARGIRTTAHADASYDGVRDLWLAVRKRTASAVSVMDKQLNILQQPAKGPLGPRRKVSNSNVRAVYGEEPPVETLFLPESYLYELYMQAVQKREHAVAPPLVLLEEFVLG